MNHCFAKSFCALWLQSGDLAINGAPLSMGQGSFFTAKDIITCQGKEAAVILRFLITTKPLTQATHGTDNTALCEFIYSDPISSPSNDVLLRLDQVDFPPGAVAYKHTHPGPGIRYLLEGGLTLESDHGEEIIKREDAWFEAANSPVKATAINNTASRFIRTMLLPIEFEGRSTFTLYDQSDADKPTMQSNTRHFEQRIRISDLH